MADTPQQVDIKPKNEGAHKYSCEGKVIVVTTCDEKTSVQGSAKPGGKIIPPQGGSAGAPPQEKPKPK
jgi:hypothetical protein